MEASGATASPRNRLEHVKRDGSEETHLQNLDLESATNVSGTNFQFQSMNALEILRESVRILRYNLHGFMIIRRVAHLPVDESIVKRLTVRLLLVAKSSGLPLRPLVKQSCQHFAGMMVSSAFCLPLYITLSFCVVYSVDCTYSKKKFDVSKFYVIIVQIWRRIVSTYMWVCMLVVGCVTLLCVLLIAVCTAFAVIGLSPDLIVYAAMVLAIFLSVVFANAIVICNIAIVISVLEDVSGPQALLRSRPNASGSFHISWINIGMAFIEGLFQHRVKTLSYGNGSSRIWEGPLLVIMYSFVVLIDSMMTAVFYFCCRYSNLDASDVEGQSILETMAVSAERMGIE
ncbi:hypothetical protein CFP56_022914 [Quercus suber]|uniref:Son of sevenless n=1 Tax=Quercus suber TaxID=58331 RepID=A0AAW0KA21_QUESU